MLGFLLLLFPFVLLGFVIFMGRVEAPLNRINTANEREIETLLDTGTREELNTFVREGTDSALRRLRKRLRPNRRRRGGRRAEN
ncbi:hypothetical protein [uncultured Jatrophihabitans sp.]|uniref:hypothetical protein n=1 Tax=uncultured Jatrophihabitans sp. TaxID=1610747 RepID=UPI0035C94C41